MPKFGVVTILQPMPSSNNVQIRAQIPQEVETLTKAIVPFKNAGKDWTFGDVVTEALIHWMQEPANRRIIEDHNLLKVLRDRGLSTDFLDE